MAISMQDIKELRELTGAGLMEVKKALEEANGDKDAAVKAIRLAKALVLSRSMVGETSAVSVRPSTGL